MIRQGWTRIGVLYLISFVEIGLAEPHQGTAVVMGGALVPAIIAWVIVRKKPRRFPRAILRGASIVFLFAGFVALGSAPDGAGSERGAPGPAGFSLTTWADAFLVIGLAGLFSSFVGEREKKDVDVSG
jgi:Na+/H+ antiporter NhaD/arsenite permease-like protein